VCVCVCVCVCIKSSVNIHSYSLTHSLTSFVRSFVLSPVKSYGVNAGMCFMGRVRPLWSIERSSRRWGAVPPEFAPLGGGTPPE
jgi:hypothetical protein